MNPRILEISENPEWDRWLEGIAGSNIRQSSGYRQALTLYGHRPEILALERSGRIVAGALLGFRRLPLGPLVGPVVSTSGGVALDSQDPKTFSEFVRALLDYSGDRRSSVVELSLFIDKRVEEQQNPQAADLEAVLTRLGFRKLASLGTYHIGLAADNEDELLRSFGKNPRRHIRKALREGLVVEPSTAPADFDDFERAHRRMTRRKGLAQLPEGFARHVLLPLACTGHGNLFVARFQEVARNYAFVGAMNNNPIYHYGAVAESARDRNCPQTGQFLHFQAMCHFRSHGGDVYDFGGSPGPVPDPGHVNFGVWKFKHEFGGRYVPFIGKWQRTLRPLSAAAIGALRQSSRLFHRLRPTGGSVPSSRQVRAGRSHGR